MKKKLWIFTIIFLLIDIVSKLLVTTYLKGESITIIKEFFSLTYAQNTGAAFSILEGKTTILIVIAVLTLGYLVYITKKNKLNSLQTIGYALFLSGILGNLIDRICYSYVIDFLHFYIGNNSFPIFNFADAFITLGAIILGIDILRGDKIENNK